MLRLVKLSIGSSILMVALAGALSAPAAAITNDQYVDWFVCQQTGGNAAVATDGQEYCYGGPHHGKIVVYPT
ncbi:hypothetical protein ACIO14_09010 [Nocardia fluminea]|uniref:hypothetical protein n=1 Tax=Nocardia fluminea TaxID=134984 RepID=UPI003825F154